MGPSKKPVRNTRGHLSVRFKNADGTLTADLSSSRLEFSASFNGATLYEKSLSFGTVKVEVGTTEFRLPGSSKAAGTYSPEMCKSARVQLSGEAELQVPEDYKEDAVEIIKMLKVERELVKLEGYSKSWEEVGRLPDIMLRDGTMLTPVYVEMKVNPGRITASIEAEERTNWWTKATKRIVRFEVAGQVEVCFRLRFTHGGGGMSLAVPNAAANFAGMAAGAVSFWRSMVGNSA